MLLAYIDESGDTGNPALGGSSACFSLGCVLIEADKWPQALDDYIAFRGRMRSATGVRLRDEIKANYLIRGSGPLTPHQLTLGQRRFVFRSHLQELSNLNARAFSVVVDKASAGVSGTACFELAWHTLLQRLERTSTKENKSVMLFHDEGENDSVRRLMRRARRHLVAGSAFGGPPLRFSARRFIDDPVPRQSNHSFFIQMADLVAYAGWRSYMAPSTRVAKVAPASLWGQIGSATHTAVNGLKPGASQPGVVIRK